MSDENAPSSSTPPGRTSGRGVREQEILDEVGMSTVRYWQRVNALIDSPAAILAEPVLTGQLRRDRDRQSTWRRAGRRPNDGHVR